MQEIKKINLSLELRKFSELTINFDKERIPLSSSERESKKGKYPYYGAQGIIDYLDEYIFNGEYLLIAEDGENLNSRSQPIANVVSGKFWVNNHAHIVKTNSECDIHYLCYLLNNTNISGYITGSAQPKLNQYNLNNMVLEIQDYETQYKISKILKGINDKIRLNEEINKNLEQLMKCIFEDWFVNFNYSEDISFKSSELGEIPSNWNVKKLSDVLITLESGKRPKGGISDIEDGIPSIGAENILGLGKFNYSKNKLISHEFFSTLKKGVIQDKDVLLYKDGAQLGRKSLFMKGFPFDICCINEHVFRLQTNDEINQFYLYLWLDQEVMTNEIINLNSNSAQPGINQNDVKSLPILVPELKIISKFNKIISPMMNQIFDNALEINKLTKLRDTLLPKLMSGEIDVSKINCDLIIVTFYFYFEILFN